MKAVIIEDQMVETGQQLINTEPEILAILWPHPEQKQPRKCSQQVYQHQHIARTAGPEPAPGVISLLSSENIDFAHTCGGGGAAAYPLREPRPVPHADGECNGMAR